MAFGHAIAFNLQPDQPSTFNLINLQPDQHLTFNLQPDQPST
ncbi:hypothetical protein [Moorena producens]|nr:hypothetical protein [Moorena producens]